MKLRPVWLAAGTTAAALSGTTCGGPSGVAPSDCSYIADPQARWEHCGPARYTAVEQRICYCPALRMWTVVVHDGVIVDAIPDPSAPGDPDALRREARARAWTVEQMFASIAAGQAVADTVVDRYDEARGFPYWVLVDPRLGIADDEILYRMLDLTPEPTAVPNR